MTVVHCLHYVRKNDLIPEFHSETRVQTETALTAAHVILEMSGHLVIISPSWT